MPLCYLTIISFRYLNSKDLKNFNAESSTTYKLGDILVRLRIVILQEKKKKSELWQEVSNSFNLLSRKGKTTETPTKMPNFYFVT